MNPTEYQKLAGRTECNQRMACDRMQLNNLPSEQHGALVATRLFHAALGLMGEVGEIAANLERWIHYGKDYDPMNLAEEIGDCLWYLALASNALGLDLGTLMEANIRKLSIRYPEKYSDQQAAEENRDRPKEDLVISGTVTASDRLRDMVHQHGHYVSDSYPDVCRVCNLVPVHKNNQERICPDCEEARRNREGRGI